MHKLSISIPAKSFLCTGYITPSVSSYMNRDGLNGGCFTVEQASISHNFGGAAYSLTKYTFNNHLNESGANRPKSYSTKFCIKL